MSVEGQRQLLQLLPTLLGSLPSAPLVAMVTTACGARVSLVLFCPLLLSTRCHLHPASLAGSWLPGSGSRMRAAVPQCCSLAGLLPSTFSEHLHSTKNWARSLAYDNRISFLLSSRRREIGQRQRRHYGLNSMKEGNRKNYGQPEDRVGSVEWRSGKACPRSQLIALKS